MNDIIFSKKKIRAEYFVRNSKKIKIESVLISNNKKRNRFIAGDNKLYFSNKNIQNESSCEKGVFVDGLNYRIISNYKKIIGNKESFLLKKYNLLIERIDKTKGSVFYKEKLFLSNQSLVRLWNFSILTAVIIGMVSMSFIYRYLGQSVSAKDDSFVDNNTENVIIKQKKEKNEKKNVYDEDVLKELKDKENKIEFESKVKKMVKGYPIEKMLPYIFKQDKSTASFLIAIAKKESNWGKRVPVLNGQDCYNYWGYRQKRKKMGSGGHTCFDSRRDAVSTVGKRLYILQKKYGRTTPEKMIVWKCGNTCSGHSAYSVKKWISDVSLYFEKINK